MHFHNLHAALCFLLTLNERCIRIVHLHGHLIKWINECIYYCRDTDEWRRERDKKNRQMDFFFGASKVGQLRKLQGNAKRIFLFRIWTSVEKKHIFDGMKARKHVKRVRTQIITRLSIFQDTNDYRLCVMLTVHSMRFEFEMKWATVSSGRMREKINHVILCDCYGGLSLVSPFTTICFKCTEYCHRMN